MIDAIAKGTQAEIDWGIVSYGGRKVWCDDVLGKVVNGELNLFHGTNEYVLPGILREGLKTSTVGHGYDIDELEEEGLAADVVPAPAIWLGYTPYLAFFFGDVAIRVKVPLSWIGEANDGVLVEREIPPNMIMEAKRISDWH